MPVALSVDRIQGLSGSLAQKISVTCVTTAAIVLEGLQTIDGRAVVDGDRVLVKDQVDQTTNGIYVASTSTWQRSLDFNKANDAIQGTLVHAYGGSTNSGMWQLTTPNPVIGTSNLTFSVIVTGAGSVVPVSDLPPLPNPSTDDGSGWVLITDGITSYWVQASTLTQTATPTFAVYSFVATGGETTITLPFSYVVGGKDLIVMLQGLVNYPTFDYTEDSANTITFLTPITAGEKVRIIANIITTSFVPTDATLAALYALTPVANKFPYFTNATTAALADISAYVRSIMNAADAAAFLTAIGAAAAGTYSQFAVAQTWQDVKASRALNSPYQNLSGKPIEVVITAQPGSGLDTVKLMASANNSTWVEVGQIAPFNANGVLVAMQVTASMPANYYYKLTGSGSTIVLWSELR